MPGSMDAFRRLRPRDINLEIAILDEEKSLTYYMFDEPAVNTLDAELAHQRTNNTAWSIVETQTVTTQRLQSVLEKYLTDSQRIDFMSIDVEGCDVDVLRSNDWNRFRPMYVLVESFGLTFEEIDGDESYHVLTNHGYGLLAKTLNTMFFQDLTHS